ncbi:hypothetical protein VCHC51A1_3102, partial [Vibrio cholerae HC-51A1]
MSEDIYDEYPSITLAPR